MLVDRARLPSARPRPWLCPLGWTAGLAESPNRAESRGAAQHTEWQFYNTLSCSGANIRTTFFLQGRVCFKKDRT